MESLLTQLTKPCTNLISGTLNYINLVPTVAGAPLAGVGRARPVGHRAKQQQQSLLM